MPAQSAFTPKAIDQVIQRNLARLNKPGVLTVRPGFEISGHQLTGKQAIVVTVHTKKANLPKNAMLPNAVAGIPVDVREATAHQRLRAQDWCAAAVVQAYSRPEDREPAWPYERSLPSGKPLEDPQSMTPKRLAQYLAKQPAAHRALVAHAKKPQVPYVPAANAPLNPISTTTTITAHVSPDAGLVTLEAFLGGTTNGLVIGMYDFTSGEILKTFEDDLARSKTLQMVLDNPPLNPTHDQTDTQTVEELDKSLGKRASIVRALDRADTLVSAWMFPYAYHIKVIVRDGAAFWLSSGNLNNSNQPDLSSPRKTEDRDWHVIIEDKSLAGTFGAYLNQDFASARQHQLAGPSQMTADETEIASAVSDANTKLAAHMNPPPPPTARATTAPPSRVPAKVFKDINVRITPLLTPDTLPGDPKKGQYLSNILQLIESAQKKLYIQLQYIEASKGTGDYDALLKAIAARVAAGVDVRLIESLQFGEKWAEKMKASGVDLTSNISLQPDVHNKGFVVDSRIVVVSSQNFSPAGVQQNRDAGVIIDNVDIAGYFEPIFLSDWNDRAKPFAPNASRRQTATSGTKKAPRKKPVRRPRKQPKKGVPRKKR